MQHSHLLSSVESTSRVGLVSIIIPLYNCEKYIHQALQSALQQTYKNIEIIVVNDGSRDKSRKIVENFSDSRIIIIDKLNAGLAAARNTGISKATGEYIGFLDADDFWHETKVASHLEHFQKKQNVGASFSFSQFCDEKGKILDIFQIGQINNIKAKDIFLKNPIGNGSTMFLRKKLVDELAYKESKEGPLCFFNPSLRQNEDVECWLRIALQTSYLIEGIPAVLTFYRINTLGLSANMSAQYAAWKQSVEILRNCNPKFIDTYFISARTYYLRYLARRAFASRKKKDALFLFSKSIKLNPLVIIFDFKRTITTALAILLLLILPPKVLGFMEGISMKVVSYYQKKKIQRLEAVYLREINE